MEHKIYTSSVLKWQAIPKVTEYYLSGSSLEPPPEIRNSLPDYKRWLWSKVWNREGAEYYQIGMMARMNQRADIVLLVTEEPPVWIDGVKAALKWFTKERLSPVFDGLPEEQGVA